jgi:hypothetical protein
MTMRNLILLAAASMIFAGCQIGKNAANFPVAHTVAGATIQIRTASQKFDAELLDVRTNGIVVVKKKDGQVAMVPWTSTQLASVKGLGREYRYGLLMPPARDVIPNLVKISHFPQGMTPEMEAKLLASKGQKEIVVVQ